VKFIKTFYSVAHAKPQDLYQFYQEDSVCARGDETGGHPEQAKGRENIKALLNKFPVPSQVIVRSMDTQPIHGQNQILTAVWAEATDKNTTRQFYQSFVLSLDLPLRNDTTLLTTFFDSLHLHKQFRLIPHRQLLVLQHQLRSLRLLWLSK
jgi:hypothetical protein